MDTTRAFAEHLRMGRCPELAPREAMAAGDEILALLDGREIGTRTINASVTGKVREVLVAFGAIEPTDYTTSPLDILAVLLPPATE